MALAMGVLLALYACWQLLGRPGGDGSLVGDLSSLPFDAAAVFGAWIAMRRCRRGSRLRWGWLLLCVALTSNLAGDVTWMLYEAAGQSPYPSAADALYLATYPLMLFGLLRFSQVRLHGASFARVTLDLAVVAIGASAVVLYVVLGPIVVEGGENALQTAFSVAYPVGDMVLLAGLASLATRRSPRSATRALQFFGAGLLCWVAADLVYGYITLHGTYRGGDPIDSMWLVAMALFAIAGTAQRSLESDVDAEPRAPARTSRAPYLAVLVGFGLLIASQVDQRLFPDLSMAVTAAVLAVLVSIRQFLAQRDLVRSQRQLSHQSLHDSLTDLPNRALVIDRAGHMLARAQRAHVPAAALYVDLDGFKRVNDSFGHAVGDELLGIVADRLREIVRDSDTAGRMGGDEFVVLIEGPALDGEVRLVAERLLEAIRRPIELSTTRGRPVSVTASIGIARAVAGSADDLLRDADFALYDAKAKGRNRYAIFESRMQMAIGDQLELELDLGDALARDEFFVLYQPTFDVATCAMTGVEALLRWRHPTRGVIGPETFIPLIEQNGLIDPIGRWVLDTACTQGVKWHRSGHPLTMSVNVSGRAFDDDRIVEDVRRALDRTGIEPAKLTLEITETALMRDAAAAAARLRKLKALGVRIAIDDFGSGYSSLSYLREFAVDEIKIDRSFVAAIATSSQARALVHTLIQLAKTLGLETLGEGVETESQLRALRRERCERGQGFLFARPLTAGAVEEFMIDAKPAATSSPGVRTA